MDAITYLKEKERLTKCSTGDVKCCKCKLNHDNNKFKLDCVRLEAEYPEEAIKIIEEWSKEIDWSKVEVDTKLLVSNKEILWNKRHFAKYEDGTIYVYQQGCSSYTTQQIEAFKHAKLWDGNC